jgi:hypothetical protein
VDFAEVLREHWPRYVEGAAGPIPSRAWSAVEAVLSCRTERRGGHVHHGPACRRHHYTYHSCNHRACPRCGAAEQAQWTRRQEARLLPASYYLLTLTAPAEIRSVFLHYPVEMVPVFFAAIASALKALCARRKFLGGNIGFIAILHTWTRRMLFHPHIHVLVPAVGLARLRAQTSAHRRVSPPGEGAGTRGAQGNQLGARPRSLRESSLPSG